MRKCELIGATNRNCDGEVVKIVNNNSWIMWMKQGEETQSPAVVSVLARIQEVLKIQLPPNNELMQVHLYNPGQVCDPHHDYYEPTNYSIKRFGQRVATLLFYLNDVAGGGHTSFPRLDLKIAPKKGDVVLFHNVTKNGEVDPRTLHAGDAIESGEKWVAIKVINEDMIKRPQVSTQSNSHLSAASSQKSA